MSSSINDAIPECVEQALPPAPKGTIFPMRFECRGFTNLDLNLAYPPPGDPKLLSHLHTLPDQLDIQMKPNEFYVKEVTSQLTLERGLSRAIHSFELEGPNFSPHRFQCLPVLL
jgi:hypothetical protein